MIVTRPSLPPPDAPGAGFAVPGRMDAGGAGVLEASICAGWLPRLSPDVWGGELAVIGRADADRLSSSAGADDAARALAPADTRPEVARWEHLVAAARACPLVPLGPAAERHARVAGARVFRLSWSPGDGVLVLIAEGGDQPECGWELDGDDLFDDEDPSHLLDRALRLLTAGALTEASVSLAAQLPPTGAPVDVAWFERADALIGARQARGSAHATDADRFAEVLAGFRRPGLGDPTPVDLPDRMLRIRRREGSGWRAEAIHLPACRVWIAPEASRPAEVSESATPAPERPCAPPPPKPMSNGRLLSALLAFCTLSGLAALAPLPPLLNGVVVASAIVAGAVFATEVSRGFKRR